MKEAYDGATEAVSELSNAAEGTKEYHNQLTKINENLSQLNSLYEVELQDNTSNINALESVSASMTALNDSLQQSLSDTKKYQQEMASLATNLSNLNSVYGNMLSAMTMNPNQTSYNQE